MAKNQFIKYKGIHYEFYHGSGFINKRLWSTNMAASKDLVHWTKYEGNPLPPIEENRSDGIPIHDGKQYRLSTTHDHVHVHVPADQAEPSERGQQ